LLALTTALSATCFVKAYGIAFLGQPRQPPVTSQPIDFGMLTAQALLAGACLLLGILPTAVVSVLTTIPQHLIGHGLPSASQQGWLWLTPISNEVASYSAPLVILAMVTVAGLVFLWLITTKKPVAPRLGIVVSVPSMRECNIPPPRLPCHCVTFLRQPGELLNS
jgi:hydrogenase-4 component B